MVKVSKFGGSSVSNSNNFKLVKDIILSDENRKVIVTSAIGKEKDKDNKVTDLLYLLYAHYKYHVNFDNVLSTIKDKFMTIKNELNLKIDLEKDFNEIIENIDLGEEYIVSRGEYLTAKMLSEYLGYKFIDSKDLIKFGYNSKVDYDLTTKAINALIKENDKVVIPGFYGSYPNQKICLFSRGGSDITGAILSRCLNAILYENFTDVDGIFMASPKIIDNPKMIDELTYDELRELSYMGASVINEETIYPVQIANIPINILNTFNKDNKGTLIKKDAKGMNNIITGVAGKKDFISLNITKNKASNKIDIISFALDILKRNKVSIESIPTSIDSFSIVVEKSSIEKKLYDIISEIKSNEDVIDLSIDDNLSLIAIVGRNMVYKPGISAKLFALLGEEKVNIKLISQNTQELSITIGVDNNDFTKAIKAIYNGVIL